METLTSAWIKHRLDLTAWATERMVNREDARGGYYERDGVIHRTTRKADDRHWTHHSKAIFAHFGATRADEIVGLHSTSPDNTSKWLAFDIDAHTDGANPDVNLKAAIEIARRLEAYKLTGHIFSSDGGGGFHVFAFFDEPIPTGQVFALARKTAENINCETFPKQPYIGFGGYGNWLRIPGKHHTKDHWHKVWTGEGWADDAGTVDYILRIEGETPVNLPAAPVIHAAATGTVVEEPFGAGVRIPLRSQTMAILIDGADAGGRNNALTACAIEMAGNGYSRAATEELIVIAAGRCRPPLDADEARSIVASAFSKPRAPWVDTRLPDAVATAAPVSAPSATGNTTPTDDEPPATGSGFKPSISNIISAKGDENERITIGKTMTEIAEDMHKALHGWPRRVSGMLFVTKPPRGLATMGNVQPLRRQEQLFAWLHTQAEVHWPTAIRKGLYSRGQDPVSAVTRTEFFEHLSANAAPDYAAVELLPHCPMFGDTYYLPCDLPAPAGDCFNEFISHLNAETDIDKSLMAAALLTPGWGGNPGQRPAFLFSSKHGRGSGKSKTAIAMMRVWGSWVTLQPDKEDWREAKSRLMDALTCRCVFIDNIRNKLSGAELESLITAPMIDAKKMYVGHFTRPNRLSFFLTSNTPRLSNDLTERSVPIHVGAPKWGKNFDKWVDKFLSDNRPQLLADIFGLLAMDPLCAIEDGNRDRWGNWQDSILTRFANGNELARAIIDRRPEADADLDEQHEVAGAIEAEIAAAGLDGDSDVTFKISSEVLLAILRKHHLLEEKYGIRGMVQLIGGMLGSSGPLKRLAKTNDRVNGKRGWLYVPKDGRIDGKTVVMPPPAP